MDETYCTYVDDEYVDNHAMMMIPMMILDDDTDDDIYIIVWHLQNT